MVTDLIGESDRVCTRCQKTKPIEQFGFSPRSNQMRRQQTCKACIMQRQAKWIEGRRSRTDIPSVVEKLCSVCGVLKTDAEFHSNRDTAYGLSSACIECCRGRDKKRYRDHKEKRLASSRWSGIKWRFGLTREEWQAILDRQDGRCATCGMEFHDKDRPCVDHDHETNAIRGMLCRKCNMAIGLLQDSSAVVTSVANYLKAHGR